MTRTVISLVPARRPARTDRHSPTRPDLRLRYEDLATDLDGVARSLSERLDVDLVASDVGRPAQHVTTPSAAASVGRWRRELDPADAALLEPIAARLGYR